MNWIQIPQDQHDDRLLTTHKHVTASREALAQLDIAIQHAQKARDGLYNAVIKHFEDSQAAVELLKKEAEDMSARIKVAEEKESKNGKILEDIEPSVEKDRENII